MKRRTPARSTDLNANSQPPYFLQNEVKSHPNITKTISVVFSSARLFFIIPYSLVLFFLGWHIHRIKSLSLPYSHSSFPDPPWWLEDTVDDFFSRTYIQDLPSVRQLNNSNFFTGVCGRYRFDTSLMPSASIIVTLQNEQDGMLTLTVNTILARTPPELLHEVIIIDDNGSSEDRRGVHETELEVLKSVSPKIKFLTNSQKQGVARGRMRGARFATAEVLVFIDSHVEMLSSTWLQHLLLPIIENPRTVAAQTLDILNDLDWSYGPGAGDLLYGVINDQFWFSYQRSRFGGPNDDGPEREIPSRRLPYETPFAAGSLFAVRRDRFLQLGGYDEGMYVWGGENTDFAIKTWVCGGRVVMVPCSRVGHMYRLHVKDTGRWPPELSQQLTDKLGLGMNAPFLLEGYSASNFSKITIRNNMRVLERWAKTSNAKTGYYKKIFGTDIPPPEWKQFIDEMEHDKFAKIQEQFKQNNHCRNFDWFDKHVFYKLTGVHHPWHPDSPGKTWT